MVTAAGFLAELEPLVASRADRLPMGEIFALAKRHTGMQPAQISLLLDEPAHAARVGAVSVMDFQARARSTTEQRRAELYRLYLDRHDRIDTWDLVDRAAPHVVGRHLAGKPRDPLYDLARSSFWPERRTAITATWYYIRAKDLDDTFALGDLLAHDPEPLVQKAVGGWLREAGKHDRDRLRAFLDRHAATMPRTALRYAVEHFDPAEKREFLARAAD